MAKKIEAFRLAGRVEVDARKAKGELKDVQRGAKDAAGALKGVQGSVGGGGLKAQAADLFSSLGNVSEILTAIPMVGGAIKGIVGSITSPLASLAQRGLEFNDIIESAQVGLTTVLGSEAEAMKRLESLKKFAVKTPFEFRDLVSYTQEMIGVGVAANDVEPYLTALGNALSAVGKGDKLQPAIEAILKMKAMGKVTAREIDEIALQGIPVWDLLAKRVGLTTKQLQKMSETGRINADYAIKYLMEALDDDPKYKGAMERMMKTRQGALSNFQDNLDQLTGQAMKSTHDGMTEALMTVNGAFDKGLGQSLVQKIDGFGGNISALFNTALKGILGGDFLSTMKDAAGNVVNTASQTIVDNTPSFIRSLSDMAVSGYDKFAEGWEIKSPSRKMKRAGEHIVQGGIDGIEAKREAFIAKIEELLKDPRVRAMLDVIGAAEGAGYNTAYGGGKFDITAGMAKPRSVIHAGNYSSSAKGRYQVMNDTEDDYLKPRLGDIPFDEHGQDVRAVALLIRRGMISNILNDDFFGAIRKGVAEWASLPKANGRSYYGQGARSDDFLANAYDKNLAREQARDYTNADPMPVAVVEYRSTARRDLDATRNTTYTPADRDPFSSRPVATAAQPLPVKIVGGDGARASALSPVTAAARAPEMLPVGTSHLDLASLPSAVANVGELSALTKQTATNVGELNKGLEQTTKDTETVAQRRKHLLEAAEADVNALKITWGQVAEGFRSVLGSALSDTNKDFKTWMTDLASSFAQMLQQMAAEMIASQVTKFLFGMISPGVGGGGAQGGLGSIASFFGGLFGGKRAQGGNVQRGRAYIVGEQGEEVFTPTGSGYITPHHKLNGRGAGDGADAQGGGANMRFVAVFDPRHVTDIMSSSEGERVFMAHFQHNAQQIAQYMQRVTN